MGEGSESIIVAVLSVFQPNLITIFTNCLANKIINEQTRKSVIFLFSVILGFVLAFLVNSIFNYGLSLYQVFLIGTGAYALGQASYRAQKIVSGTNGSK